MIVWSRLRISVTILCLAACQEGGDITPPSLGRIQVTTSTSGPDPDSDGYTLEIVGPSGITTSVAIPGSGTVTTPVPLLGTYTVTLKAVTENCLVRDDARRKLEVINETIIVVLDVRCTPVTQLAFVRDGQIYLVNSNGSGLVKLTDTGPGVWNGDPAWSPDGKRIAFTSNRSGQDHIYVMNADGSNLVRRTDTGALNVAPSWSPDGKKIAFSGLQGQWGIYVMNVDADWSSPKRLGCERGYQGDPAWSPDGGTIAFVSDWLAYDFVLDLYVMGVDGSGPRLLLPSLGSSIHHYQPAWSPDGRNIAVVACIDAWSNCYPNSNLVIITSDGRHNTVLASPGGFAKPTWSRDGRTLAFSSTACEDCAASIRYVRADGTGEGLIVANGRRPAWRP